MLCRMGEPAAIREEELKNRVATAYFNKYDCDRIVGNIDHLSGFHFLQHCGEDI